MKRITISLFFALLPTLLINAQVGIGTTNPNASLDIKSSNEATPANTDGILIPKIDEFPASDPTALQDGMMVFATGNGSVTKGFYYWDNNTTSWTILSGSGAEKINDLLDAKSDNDGTQDGSSIFLGINAGLNDDGTDNRNIGIGYHSLYSNTTGVHNTANGYLSLFSNTTGVYNTANGYQSLYYNTLGSYNSATGLYSLFSNTTGVHNTAVGSRALQSNITGNNNVAIGSNAGYLSLGDSNVFIGQRAGYFENNSNRLYIENTSTANPLIYGEFDNNLLRVNGDFEVEKPTDVSMTAKSPFGNKASLKLYETDGSLDYGFEFEYDGSPDKLYLWSRTFAGNEGIRMTWLKNGKVGISTTSPNALLDVSSTNPAAPKNTDGMLVPRIDAFPSSNPTASQNGMLVFLTTDNTFYYWRNSTTSWVSVSNVQKINDLVDGKSDNDGSQNGSSVYLGINAGSTDDNSDNRNVGIGFQTLQANSIGSTNTSVGYQSMKSNTGGFNNVAVGTESLFLNTSGNSNVALGDTALYSNTTGDSNTAIGWESLKNNTTANGSVAIGYRSLYLNTTGTANVAIGFGSLRNNLTANNNIAVGYQSLQTNSTGNDNVGIGFQSLFSNLSGSNNMAIGKESLRNNTGNNNVAFGNSSLFTNTSGIYNVAIGYQSLYTNSTGNNNIAIGYSSLYSNSSGIDNVAIGKESLRNNTGNYNVALGNSSLFTNTSGDYNLAIGYRSLYSNTIGFYNTAIGFNSLFSNTTGTRNVANGSEALSSNTTGYNNVANGFEALSSNTTGVRNVANGSGALTSNTSGNYNVANGESALSSNTTGSGNTADGIYSLISNTTGNYNVAIGYEALKVNTVFDNNTAIGTAASITMNGFSNTTAIGYDAIPSSPNQVRLGNASVAVIGGNAPWSNFSDKRIKTNIKEDIVGLEFIKKLRPVSYNLDMDAIARYEKTPDSLRLKDAERLKAKEIQTGFIAQEVEIAANEVGFNFHGVVKPYTKNDLYALSYSEFVVPLVKAVQEQQTQIETLKKEIAEIKALLLDK